MTLRRNSAAKTANHKVMLCSACQAVLARIKTGARGTWTGPKPELFGYPDDARSWRGVHHTEDGSFLAAVEAPNRCYICFYLHRNVSREDRKRLRNCRSYFQLWPERADENRYSIHFTLELMKDDSANAPATDIIESPGKFKLFPRSDLPNTGSRLHLTSNTFTSECQSQVRQWLETCTVRHERCADKWQTRSNFNIRLLNVGLDLQDTVRLDSFGGDQGHPQYVTLSHCWNTDEFQRWQLTTKNCQRLENAFPISTLPPKFRHAIDVARWMGVKFIWIDALCVLQDSKTDWLIQANNMGNIYAASYCNIAATNGEKHAGLLGSRSLEIAEPLTVANPRSDEIEPSYILGFDDFFCSSLLDTRLHNRGWVLQERLLAPRTIHFGQEQIIFECRELKASEAYPEGIPDLLCNRRTREWRKGAQIFSPAHNGTKAAEASWFSSWFTPKPQPTLKINNTEAYDFWRCTVERYMDCKLTYDEDKLIAIAGIASKLATVTGERYLAGLWENSSLVEALLWYVPMQSQEDGSPSKRTPPLNKTGYRAPSWSWASLDARIWWSWPTASVSTLATVKDVHVSELNSLHTGAIESARMRIEASLIPAQVRILSSHTDGSIDEDGSYALLSKTDCGSTTDQVSTDTALIYLDTAIGVREMDVYLLPICTKWAGRFSVGLVMDVAGLIVRKVGTDANQVYERVGFFGLDEDQIGELQPNQTDTEKGVERIRWSTKESITLI